MFDTHLQVALLLDPFPIVATDQIRGVRSVKLQQLAHPGQWNPDQNKNQMICVGLSNMDKSQMTWVRYVCSFQPGESFVPWREVAIEEVAEDFEGF